jgi:hypothetical protein
MHDQFSDVLDELRKQQAFKGDLEDKLRDAINQCKDLFVKQNEE